MPTHRVLSPNSSLDAPQFSLANLRQPGINLLAVSAKAAPQFKTIAAMRAMPRKN
jgi:hypothetical protein